MKSKSNAMSRKSLFGPKLGRTLLPAALFAALMFSGAGGFAQTPAPGGQRGGDGRRVSEKVKPFKIIGNIYYVGGTDMTVFLITTPEGNILIDSTYEQYVPMIRESIEALGFKMRDVKILLNSHAHPDHVEGHSMMKELTGAQVVMSEADGKTLAEGGGTGRDGKTRFKPVKANRIVAKATRSPSAVRP